LKISEILRLRLKKIFVILATRRVADAANLFFNNALNAVVFFFAAT